MSPIGDLAFSFGGLRVPARARLVFQYFVSRFIVWVCCGAGDYRDCIVTGREDAVHYGGALDWGFYR